MISHDTSRFNCRLDVAIFSIILVAAASSIAGGAEPTVSFDRDIRPILSDTCFFCHGPDKNAREADLRLDIRDEALKLTESGITPIVPGKPAESEIIRRIFSENEDELMPPPDSHKKLTQQQKELFRQWVAEGANYQTHWLYAPLNRPSVPTVIDAAWPVNPIDDFVLQPLEAKKIKPSREADRRTLLRRLSLDLIGLPPMIAEVDAFVADTSSDAYERQVDRLLKSPQFGERMAVWWLDVARFTDTVGFHGDQNQRIFPYRDYVIAAFNKNKPFDQFTREQLAGDLLPNPTTEQLVATGFNRLNMMTREGGAQPKEYLAKYGAERVRTVGTTWLGSTLGCCECHDHKYDPFTSRDFYSMSSFFGDIKQWGVYSDYGYTPNPELKGWSNDHPFPPEIEVENEYLQRRERAVLARMNNLYGGVARQLASDEESMKAFRAWRSAIREFLGAHSDGWYSPPFKASVVRSGKLNEKIPVEVTGDSVIRFGEQPTKSDELRVEVDCGTTTVAAIRVEIVPDQEDPDTAAALRQTIRVSAAVKPAKGKEFPVEFYFADADQKEPRYANTEDVLGITSGWLTPAKPTKNRPTSYWLLEAPLTLPSGRSLVVKIKADSTLPPVRVMVSPLASVDPLEPLDAELIDAICSPDTADEISSKVAAAYLRSATPQGDVWLKYVALHREYVECRHGRAWTMVTVPAEPLTTRVLPRGNWLDESGAVVDPAVPHFLPQPANNDRRLTRLDLANWLCGAENPVTARAVINRLWKPFFGNALSNVVDDLGAQGEPPSHPGLLDWLAVEFRDSGWNVKHMIKLMVTSRTYRQESRLRSELAELDPANRWLASQNPRRLDAEFVRDNALAIAGLLNPDIGGPSAKPYQPADYYANLQFPNRDYADDVDDRQWRRGVYMHWQRTFLHPMLANFDAPAREECTANRVVSNTPQQALTLLNDPTFVEAARALAKRLLAEAGANDEARLDRAFQLALARPVKAGERESLLKFLAAQREHYRGDSAAAEKLIHVGIAPVEVSDRAELAAWTSVGRVVLNLQETITRY